MDTFFVIAAVIFIPATFKAITQVRRERAQARERQALYDAAGCYALPGAPRLSRRDIKRFRKEGLFS